MRSSPRRTARRDIVTIRIRIIAADANFYIWQMVLPGTVTSIAPSGGGGGGGGGSDGGCSTGEESDLAWLGLLALLGVFGVATRLRA